VDGATQKERERLDDELDRAAWLSAQAAAEVEATVARPSKVGARVAAPPAWWKGEAEAEQTTMVLGARIQAVNRSG
jgi:hypothetical protein